MTKPRFGEPRDLWERDGSLRDVYLFDANKTDWLVLLSMANQFGARYLCDGAEMPLPSVEDIFSNREVSHLLQVSVGRVTVNCHFFVPGEIELDIDPRDVNGPQEHAVVLEILEQLAQGASKSVVVTAENSEDAVYLRYEPEPRKWTAFEPAFGDGAHDA
ncbi:hypothetical protein [Paucibacter sp. XJ19-41]|uniref:hypothetical protein n=1 Tax=Paucibacter sp. XJ19-41 TaxID=2927824 RepID=UPI0023490C89|nr:hypothetical protein [Paucibacter sp. XJ19-41]MDC6166482.1 hypothetical protein [Paucibacter sp. XJ19-41]